VTHAANGADLPIAVIIPTRNRGASAADAVRAVLKSEGRFQLIVVDQSTNDDTFLALAAIDDDRLSVLRSDLTGISNARNLGVRVTRAPILAFTDDDCRPEPGWILQMLARFQEDPSVSLVFGRVTLPPADPGDYAPSFEPQERFQERRAPLPNEDIGIGASFAIRRTTLEALGGFDPLLGAGAPFFRGAEETDVLIRALASGYRVLNDSASSVLHVGLRTGEDVRPLHVAYQRSVGAAFGKYARLMGWPGLRDCARWVFFYTALVFRDFKASRHPRLGVLYYFVTGAVLTFRYGLDRDERRLTIRRSSPWARAVRSTQHEPVATRSAPIATGAVPRA
jgi:GT2 family glycosyltransferase